ncbi:hypothetical protein [Bremerella cremea]|uniref:hypothetical protein n=1 Tax=Bremerella cremea TaxID=1031537 RepID=UPI0031F0E460
MQHLISQQRVHQLREKAHAGWKLTLRAQGCLATFRTLGDPVALDQAEQTLKSLEEHLHAMANGTESPCSSALKSHCHGSPA